MEMRDTLITAEAAFLAAVFLVYHGMHEWLCGDLPTTRLVAYYDIPSVSFTLIGAVFLFDYFVSKNGKRRSSRPVLRKDSNRESSQ